MNPKIALVGMLCLGLAAPAGSQVMNTSEDTPLYTLAQRIAKSFIPEQGANPPRSAETPSEITPVTTKDFHPDFLSQVPFTQVQGIFSQFGAGLGSVDRVELVKARSPVLADFSLIFSKGFRVPMVLGISTESDPRVNTLWLGNPTPIVSQVEDFLDDFNALDGEVSLLVTEYPQPSGESSSLEARLNSSRTILSLNPQKVLNIGSSFKLYVLSELLNQVQEGAVSWDDSIRLEPAQRSLPSGFLQTWPDHAPVTLYTAAALMISQSDNTATDMLVNHLGASAIERRAVELGLPQEGLPILPTNRLFALKADAQVRSRFIQASTPQQRRAVITELAPQLPNLDQLYPGGQPVDVLTTGYLSTTESLTQTMARLWLRDGVESDTARGILSINPGIAADEQKIARIGFKGGSEPGAINMTMAVQGVNGKIFVISATWNNPVDPVKQSEFVGLLQGIAEALTEK